MNTEILELVKSLAVRVHSINITAHAGIFGSNTADAALMQLRKASAELMAAVQQALPLPKQFERLQDLDSALRSANLVGVLSEGDLQPFMDAIDKLYVLTDKEV